MTEGAVRTALVTGATGYIGSRLVPELLAAGWRVRVLTRNADGVAPRAWFDQVEVIEGDATDPAILDRALTGADVAYYLLHSMDGKPQFERRDRAMARGFAAAARRARLGRIVYLSGLHPDGVALSAHLDSRVEVGEILLDSDVPTVVLQAAVIIGSGSASFEMLRHLTRRLPAMIAPKWLHNRIQPIAVRDILHYLVAAADLPPELNRTFDVGGPDVLTYKEMIERFARLDGLWPRIIVTVPVLTPWLAGHWVGVVTPVPASIAKPLVGSLVHEVICKEDDLAELVPPPPGGLLGFDEAVQDALGGERSRPEPGTVDPGRLTSADPDWAG
jgi:uncharacterized protein YbjT (DUF2867 family)